MPLIPGFEYNLKDDYPPEHRNEDVDLFLDAFNIPLQEMCEDIDRFTDLIDPDAIPVEFLDLFVLSRGFRTAIDFPGVILSETEKRKLVRLSVPLLRQKGTGEGIRNIIRLLLGLEAVILTQFNVDVWRLDVSELGYDTYLFSSTVGNGIYFFEIELTEEITPEQEQKLIALVEFMKPIYMKLFQIKQPNLIDHVELGFSELGDTFELH